jgi:hypothetical protein
MEGTCYGIHACIASLIVCQLADSVVRQINSVQAIVFFQRICEQFHCSIVKVVGRHV